MTARRFLLSAVLGLVISVLAWVGPASAYHTDFQGTCFGTAYNITGKIKRSQARSYAYVGKDEGYQWGGGCWNNNNVDDSPGDPSQDSFTAGEGGDCSGFTFKSWYLRLDTSASGFRVHDAMEKVHGPYQAWEYHDGVGAPVFNIARADAVMMDAWASSFHVGMIYTANVALNADDIIEAKGESVGTKILRQTYRGDTTNYAAARRVFWLAECSPSCAGRESGTQ